MSSKTCKNVRRSMVLVEDLVGFLEKLMDAERPSAFNSNNQQQNRMVIRWLREHDAPADMIERAIALEAQGSDAILVLLEEIMLMEDEYVVMKKEFAIFLVHNVERAVLANFLKAYSRKRQRKHHRRA